MYTNIIKTHSPKLPLLALIQSQLLISLGREDEKTQAGKKHNGEGKNNYIYIHVQSRAISSEA